MAISAIGSAAGSSYGSSKSVSSVDTESMSLQTKIAQTQQKIRDVNSSSVLSPEDKDKKESQLKEELVRLNEEYRRHRLDLQTEKRQELLKSEESEDTAKESDTKEDLNEEAAKTADNRASGKAILSDDTEMLAAKMRSTAGLERQARLLQSEIKVDSMRPETSTEAKSNELDDIYTRLYKNAAQDFMNNNSQVVKSSEDGTVTANIAAASGMFANAMVDFTL